MPHSIDHAERSRSKNTPVTRVVEQISKNPNLTYRQLAKLNNTSHVAMIKLLQRHGITKESCEVYQQARPELLAGLQERILAAVTDADLEKASLRDKVISAGVLYDKERLERGLSTANIGMIVASAVARSLDDGDTVIDAEAE